MNTRNSNSNLFFICLFCLIIGVILFLIYGEYTAKKKKKNYQLFYSILKKKKELPKNYSVHLLLFQLKALYYTRYN